MRTKALSVLFLFAVALVADLRSQSVIDPTFNPDILANVYLFKHVFAVEVQPDDKIVVYGYFSSFNRLPVGRVVRLNADGSLDTTFNSQTVTSSDNAGSRVKMIIQPNGKILLTAADIVANGMTPKRLIRLNSDGTLDTSFNYTQTNLLADIAVDSQNRAYLVGTIQTSMGNRSLVRLNDDGSVDTAFNYTPANAGSIVSQGSKIIVGGNGNSALRLNENGSVDTSFVSVALSGFQVNCGAVQSDGKILILGVKIYRLLANGGFDTTWPEPSASGNLLDIGNDGKIVTASTASNATFRRYLSTGVEDPSFTPFQHPSFGYSFGLQSGSRIITGDQTQLNNSTVGPNNFYRLTDAGAIDTTFNPGGLGFQNIGPGNIRAIEPQSNGKLMIGGKFDVINGVERAKIARLNADSTVDQSFQINTTASGNYFQIIRDVYQMRTQPDGKVIVSGWFDYVLNGVAKRNFLRLNTDGSIDPTFELNVPVDDWSEIVGGGRNRFAFYGDGNILLGNSRLNGFNPVGPWKLTSAGIRDTSLNSMLNPSSVNMYIDDVILQSDGKILVSGTNQADSGQRSFTARLNGDGSLDQTFAYNDEAGRVRSLMAMVADGKFLVATHPLTTGVPAKVIRRNAAGTVDSTFTSLSIPDGIINAILVMPDGKIFVGGRFTLTVSGQTIRNLVRLNPDGTVDPTAFNVNEEVLALAIDAQGRLMVGGRFTVIGVNGAGANRTYIARLANRATQFDYDGDGKADISVFRPSENKWYVLRSSDGAVTQPVFAVNGDIAVPADYDGDRKTDIAIYRPASADWWSLSSLSGGQINANWGQANVRPLPSDFDGDGKSDYLFFLPGNSTWYRFGSTVGASYVAFGSAGDKPLIGDFDGDGKSDVAIFRPSTGDWWWQSSVDNVQRATHWGISTDIPAPADFDGDGKTDFAVFRPSTGIWYVYNSSNGSATIMHFGIAEDKPVPADYDGDGKADIAVFRPSTGIWYQIRSTAGFNAVAWGSSGDIPTPNASIP
ncbi:MAG TPA: FG-GAP-like repeat-containing protein [Pyrinomonadaceae bacterium]|nr:FG-GAP-like repeat-containing protein [Pyrinomonadaceae bacterium]